MESCLEKCSRLKKMGMEQMCWRYISLLFNPKNKILCIKLIDEMKSELFYVAMSGYSEQDSRGWIFKNRL